MPTSCCAIGCANRHRKGSNVKFYRFPTDALRRDLWVSAMRRENWSPKEHSRLCSEHFLSKKPSMFINDPDYVPSVFVFSSITSYKDRRSRYERLMKRRKKVAKGPHKHDHLDNVSQLSPSVQATEQDPFTEDISEDDTESIEDNVKSIEDGEDDMLAEENITTEENMDIGEDRSVTTTDKNLSTDIDANDWYAIEKRITEQQELIEMLQSELRGTRPSIKLQNDDNQVHFYTGLPSYSVFIGLLKLLVGVMSKHLSHGLSVSDQFLMVLMKLRLAVPNQDLAYRFGISTGRVSQLFHEWIDVMARELGQLIRWPHRETIRENLPDCFKATYPKTTCIIDCSEIFIERATSLCARSQTYLNYKSHNTAKFLVAISATGAIIFISKCWGGRASDKYITSHSGFLFMVM